MCFYASIYNAGPYVYGMHSIKTHNLAIEVYKSLPENKKRCRDGSESLETDMHVHMHPIYWHKRLMDKEG